MLSQIIDGFRRLFSSNKDTKRPRERETEEEYTPPTKKRRRSDLAAPEPQAGYWEPSMADWVTQKRSTFADNYYLKQLANSPKHLMSFFSGKDAPEMQGQGFTIEHRPAPGSVRPVPNQKHCPTTNTTDFLFVPESGGARVKRQALQPVGGDGIFSNQRDRRSQHARHPPTNKPFITSRPLRKKLAVNETIRLEDKLQYARLLEQCARGSSQTVKRPLNTLCGLQKTAPSPKQFTPTLSKSVLEVRTQVAPVIAQHVTPATNSTPTQPEVIDLTEPAITERSFSFLQSRSDARSTLAVQGGTETVAGEQRVQEVQLEDTRVVKLRSPVIPLPPSFTKTPIRDQFEQSVKDCTCLGEDWLQSFKKSLSGNVKEVERKVLEYKTKVDVYQQQRREWEDQLENRIRRSLKLSRREPVVIEEQFSDEEDDIVNLTDIFPEAEEVPDEFPEMTEEQEASINQALRPSPPGEVLVEGYRLQLTRQDINTLSGLNWLNDEVINFYTSMLMERGEKETYPSVHAFNTFFYPKLMKTGHSSVRRWTKKVDILAMDFMLVPVHLGMHWCLAVVDFGLKEIQYYDSMGGRNDSCLNALKNYLSAESLDKKGENYDTSSWNLIHMQGIPQQMNGSDCGMFTCKFAEFVTRRAPITFTQEHMPYFRRRMVLELLTKTLL